MAVVTIRDIAKAAGVSTATVSRVINGFGGVKPATVQKVREAIKEVHFIPNATARNLKTDTTHTVGFLISNISNSHFTSMAKVIDHTLQAEGYSIIVCSTDDDPAAERNYLRRLMGLHVDGIIMNTTGQNEELLAEVSQTMPIVLVDRSVSNATFVGDFVGSNGFEGVRGLTKHLIEYGHRDIAIITSNLRTSTGRERLAGFVAAMAEVGVTVDDRYPYLYNSQFFNVEGGVAGCKHLISLEKRPTAIVVANNDMAIGVYKYLHNRGIEVPKDISVASYGNISNGELFRAEPTCTTLNPAFIGEKAAKLLLSRILNPSAGNREVIFEPLLLLNETTRHL